MQRRITLSCGRPRRFTLVKRIKVSRGVRCRMWFKVISGQGSGIQVGGIGRHAACRLDWFLLSCLHGQDILARGGRGGSRQGEWAVRSRSKRKAPIDCYPGMKDLITTWCLARSNDNREARTIDTDHPTSHPSRRSSIRRMDRHDCHYPRCGGIQPV